MTWIKNAKAGGFETVTPADAADSDRQNPMIEIRVSDLDYADARVIQSQQSVWDAVFSADRTDEILCVRFQSVPEVTGVASEEITAFSVFPHGRQTSFSCFGQSVEIDAPDDSEHHQRINSAHEAKFLYTAEGAGAHVRAEARIRGALAAEGCDASVVTSAGALVTTLHDIKAARIGMIAPYAPALTDRVRAHLQAEGIEVSDVRSLSVTDNTVVRRLDPAGLIPLADGLKTDVDAVVLSACVQMPSLASIEIVEQRLGVPVLSAATATVFQLLRRLNLSTIVPGAGRLLSGVYDPPTLNQRLGREAT